MNISTAKNAFEGFVRERIEEVEREVFEDEQHSQIVEKKEAIINKLAAFLRESKQEELLREWCDSQYDFMYIMYQNVYIQAMKDTQELPIFQHRKLRIQKPSA